MKIVVLSHRVPYPPNKGEKIRTYNQVKFLESQGNEIHLFSPYDSDEELSYFEALELGVCKSVAAFRLPFKLARLLTGYVTGKSLSVANFYVKSLQDEFDRFVAENKVDAILCTASSMAEYVFKSNTLKELETRPRLIMDFMDVDSDKWAQYQRSTKMPMSWVYKREHKLVSQFEREITDYFDVCYLIAQAEVTLFKDKVVNNENVCVLGNGLDMSSFYPSQTKAHNTEPVLLFTGVMDYKPNVDAVLWFVENCWQNILSVYPNARFIIAGMNPTREVTALAHRQGVEVTGFVDEILPYYQTADIFVAPFRLARGVQNKVLQAFSCALPVVSTPMGAEGINCVADDSILIASTPSEFIAQVTRLATEPELSERIGAKALQLIKQEYSWEGQLSPILDFLLAHKNVNEKGT
ncbi:TIGR03087 family PEP-CTERM/XrtA system glycosyltransferase [Paraglaciecola polaris]|uniref:TIGR03087 family PEP-CTERM/XrtA system glycosyltransferase n=2 Tax=Paraglaciecola polaris TaxID=222814 RepID=UPI0030ED0091|tara:strand:- start:8259 stop:9488 length:1230 start_codon:yes stop_codon:yes gene_type:complete